MSLTSDLHLTHEDAELVLHPAPDGEPVPGLLRLDQRHLVHHHTGGGGHLGGPGKKTGYDFDNKVLADGVTPVSQRAKSPRRSLWSDKLQNLSFSPPSLLMKIKLSQFEEFQHSAFM